LLSEFEASRFRATAANSALIREPILSQQLCERFMCDLASRDVKNLEKWFHEKSVLWMPPSEPVEGQRRILTLFRLIFRMYTDLNWKVTEYNVVSPTRVIYLSDSWGTIGKGVPYKNHILTIVDFNADGQIDFLSDYFKDTAIFQAGKTPSA
jgi:hypothetical protein